MPSSWKPWPRWWGSSEADSLAVVVVSPHALTFRNTYRLSKSIRSEHIGVLERTWHSPCQGVRSGISIDGRAADGHASVRSALPKDVTKARYVLTSGSSSCWLIGRSFLGNDRPSAEIEISDSITDG